MVIPLSWIVIQLKTRLISGFFGGKIAKMLQGFNCERENCLVARLRVGKYGRLNVNCKECGLIGDVGEVGVKAEEVKSSVNST
ncbi:MAG: hypothetical protein G01um101416_1096 [Microgenomates group bacterium Gr01-1014_16]|nr:MAG: hypothetical protein G01um101416_1096 [Microgenomates group bacterium Gr01-1014_16]